MPVNPPFINEFNGMAVNKANGFSVQKAPKTAGELTDNEIGFLSMVVQMVNDGTISLPAGLEGGAISDMLSGPTGEPVSKEKLPELLQLLKQEGKTPELQKGDSVFDLRKLLSEKMPVSPLETAGDETGKTDALKIALSDTAQDGMPEEDGQQMRLVPETVNAKSAVSGNAEAAQDGEVRSRRPIDSSIMDQIGKAFLRNENGRSEIRLNLHPPELGNLRMSIITHDNQVTVKIIAEAPMVKDIIDNNLNQLRADLGEQGLEIENFDVSVSQDHVQNGRDFDPAAFAETDGPSDESDGSNMPEAASPNRGLLEKSDGDNGRINYFV